MSDLQLACGGDLNYLPHTAAMLHSFLTHRGGLAVHVHYLHSPRLRPRERDRLASMVERHGGTISFVAVREERLSGLPEMREIPAAMWYRAFLPELLPDPARVLYVDADTIAMDALEPLWATDLTDSYVAAVDNVWEPWNLDFARSLGLAQPYFNSGVLLLNLELMRRDDCMGAMLDFARANRSRLGWPDQDALNVVLGSRRVALHPRWNCMNSVMYFRSAAELFGTEAVEQARSRPGIRHFEGPSVNKPWHLLCQWEGVKEYRRHRRQTPWPRYVPAGLTPRNLLVWTGRKLGPRRGPAQPLVA